jgi:hypothetical protein
VDEATLVRPHELLFRLADEQHPAVEAQGELAR